MADIEKKTLVEILRDIEFIRGQVDTVPDVHEELLDNRCEHISNRLIMLCGHIETNLVEKENNLVNK
jgi:hypothetical protein